MVLSTRGAALGTGKPRPSRTREEQNLSLLSVGSATARVGKVAGVARGKERSLTAAVSELLSPAHGRGRCRSASFADVTEVVVRSSRCKPLSERVSRMRKDQVATGLGRYSTVDTGR